MKKYFLLIILGGLIWANNASAVETTNVTNDLQISKPVIEVNIPQLTFSDVEKNIDSEGYLHLPWIGEYIAAVYKFGLAIISIIAVVMIIIQGLRIITSGGGENKNAGYKKILQAVIGLFIAWGSYAILYTVNPALVEFKALKVQYIEPELISEVVSGEFLNQTSAEISAQFTYNPSVTPNGQVPFFAQCDQSAGRNWANVPFGPETVCKQGCGITSLAMVLTFYKDKLNPKYQNLTTPGDVARVILNEKIRLANDTFKGTNFTVFNDTVKLYGLKTEAGISEEKAKEYLTKGAPVVANVKNANRARDKGMPIEVIRAKSTCRFTGGGHYIVLTGYDKNTDIYSINDPAKNIPPPERKQATSKYMRENCAISFLYVHPTE